MVEVSKCLVDAQSAESGSESRQSSQQSAPEPSLSELVALLVAELRESNRNTQMLLTHIAVLIDLVATDQDEVDEVNGVGRYLDGTSRN